VTISAAENQRAIFARKQHGILPSVFMPSFIAWDLCGFSSVLYF